MGGVTINLEKCVGCNSCIKACPAKDANVASFNEEQGRTVITIDNTKCIKCGACIHACTHGARDYCDDTQAFFSALASGESLYLIVAPAIGNTFGQDYVHALDWLRQQGVKGIYDVSLGADICTWAHLRYLKQHPGAKLISQPCAAIVNYALNQRPKLLENLSPVHSPMLCTAVYMKKYLGINGKIAALSPCVAKTDEFAATGLVSYNVTLKRLREYIADKKIDLRSVAPSGKVFDGEQALDGAVYPKPGGLKRTLLAHEPGLNVVNSEGVSKVYSELNEYLAAGKGELPAVFDVLNCEFGCNEGPGVGEEYKPFKISSIMHRREQETTAARRSKRFLGRDRQFSSFDRRFRLEDFCRSYESRYDKYEPSAKEIEAAYLVLNKKTSVQRNFNCHACGFDTCADMAKAVARGINVPENCRMYLMDVMERQKEKVSSINSRVLDMTHELASLFETLTGSIETVRTEAGDIGERSQRGVSGMKSVNESILELSERNRRIAGGLDEINAATNNYRKMTRSVEAIADTINLLSVNASVEAARAGEAGKGFAVVAGNIKQLSQTSVSSVSDAQLNDERVARAIADINKIVEGFIKQSEQLTQTAADVIGSVESASQRSQTIIAAVEEVNSLASRVYHMIEETEAALQN